jgi:hypothetical protein
MPDGSEPLDAAPAPPLEVVPDKAPLPRMNLREFIDLGYLQEVNRQFLHPLGLALSLHVGDDPLSVQFDGIIDNRDDLEGWNFNLNSYEDPARAVSRFKSNVAHVEVEWERRRPIREKQLGYMVQPVTDSLIDIARPNTGG